MKTPPIEGQNDSPKPKKKPNIPASSAALASLGVDVANNWQAYFPSLRVEDEDAVTLAQNASQLKTYVNDNELQKATRKQNSEALKKLVKTTTTASVALKSYLKAQLNGQQNINVELAFYGFQPNKKGTYVLPTDHTTRKDCLLRLVAKLQEPNNPIAAKTYGLSWWQQASHEFSQAWQDSNQLRSERSLLSGNILTLTKTVKNSLSKVNKTLAVKYNGEELGKKRRGMGFLKESI